MKISQLIFFGFFFVLLLFIITTYINYQQSEAVKENAEFVTRSSTIVQQSNRFLRNTLNIVSGLRGYLLTGESSFFQTYDSTVTENKTILAELKPLVAGNNIQSRTLDSISLLHNEWKKDIADPITAMYNSSAKGDRRAQLDSFYRTEFLSDENTSRNLELQRKLRQFINSEYNTRELKKSILANSIQQTKKISLYLTVLSIVAGLIIALLLAFGISNRVLKMVNMSNTIAAGNYNVHMKETGNDELGRLAQSLNHMAEVLDENFTLLKRKNEELDQFAHIVSHDMKAPLRGIDNVISWIEEDHEAELTPKIKEYLELIKGRVARAENLIGGILSYARVGKEEQFAENINVKELIQEIEENISPGKKITISIADNLPLISSQRLPLFQVFSNLISNAVKYNDKEKGLISVYHEAYPEYYRFFVKDNGPGIAENYHKKIFQIFQTLQERDSFESTGVGLAIVKKILDARNEEIGIESVPGEGSVFSFTWSRDVG
jgi:signal transduction histidine kinase